VSTNQAGAFQKNGRDRRRNPRIDVHTTATLYLKDRCIGKYRVKDLSTGGALIIGDCSLNNGDLLSIELELPDVGMANLVGEVARVEYPNEDDVLAAMQFHHISSRSEDMVRVAVDKALLGRPDSAVILVVDQCSATRANLCSDLGTRGFTALEASSPAEAKKQLFWSDQTLTTALVDVDVLDDDGMGLVEFMAIRYPGIRRILMSDRICSTRAKFGDLIHGTLSKPWTTLQLSAAVEA